MPRLKSLIAVLVLVGCGYGPEALECSDEGQIWRGDIIEDTCPPDRSRPRCRWENWDGAECVRWGQAFCTNGARGEYYYDHATDEGSMVVRQEDCATVYDIYIGPDL